MRAGGELGDNRLAEDSLASAFMLAGREIVDDEDPKYEAFILPKLKPSAIDG